MVAGGDHHDGDGTAPDGERFALERFEWVAPDRLDVAGTFLGLGATPSADPALLVRGASGWRCLPAVAETLDEPPHAGEAWSATFSWQETPIPFDAAELAFGDELAVQLPDPRPPDASGGRLILTVLRADGRPDDEVAARAAGGEDADDMRSLAAQMQQIRLETELLAAQEQVRELQDAADRAAAELVRVKTDLDTERSHREAEAERFRDGLAEVRELAERTVADAEREADRHAAELDAARSELDAARSELDAAHAELATLRPQAQKLAGLQRGVGEVRDEARRTLDRLTGIAEAVDDHGES